MTCAEPDSVANAPGVASDAYPSRTIGTHRATLATVVLLSAFTLYALRSIVPAALLGAWVAGVSEPWSVRIARRLGGRTRAASLLTVSVILFIAAIAAALVLPVISDVTAALRVVRGMITSSHATGDLTSALNASSSGGRAGLFGLVREIGPIATEAVAAAGEAFIQLMVFVATAYYLAIDGRRLHAGLERVSPLGAENTRQFLNEFIAVGRGIAVSMGLAGLVTAVALGTAYIVVGVPRPVLLIAFTFIAAMAPVGAPIVWIPIALWLFTRGQVAGAMTITAVGIIVVSGLIDHVLRPWLMRFGKLSMHPLLTLLGLLGGVVAFGAWGVFLGPLLFAMTATAMRVHAGRPILARRSLIPGERITRVSIAPALLIPPSAIPPDLTTS